jgi:chaperonin GroES
MVIVHAGAAGFLHRSCVTTCSGSLHLQAARRFIPLLDRILVERVVPDKVQLAIPMKYFDLPCSYSCLQFLLGQVTKGGVLLQETKGNQEGVVVAVGQGFRAQDGSYVAPLVKAGDRVLLPEFGGAKLTLEGKVCIQSDDVVIRANFLNLNAITTRLTVLDFNFNLISFLKSSSNRQPHDCCVLVRNSNCTATVTCWANWNKRCRNPASSVFFNHPFLSSIEFLLLFG